MKTFKRFDVVEDYSDHYYAKSRAPSKTTEIRFGVYRLMKEFETLEEDLPDSIFVRSYEGRMDLLRAVIIGADGTPYHDGLFFFDIRFSSTYPIDSPKIHYHSFGLRINPLLSENGKVNLGEDSYFTVLEILLSIQALVLTAKPYNLRVYGPWAGRLYSEKKALAYNEDVFINSCKTMLRVLRNPPMHFQVFVAQHFLDHGAYILHACRAYIEGRVMVGGLIENWPSSLSFNYITVSKQFKNSMEILYPKLSAAFTVIELSLMNIVEEEKPLQSPHVVTVEAKDGLVKAVLYKILKCTGFKSYACRLCDE